MVSLPWFDQLVKTRVDQVVKYGRGMTAKERLTDDVLAYLLETGDPAVSLRTVAGAIGVGHSLLLYHFGSHEGLLMAVHEACEQRQRVHLAGLEVAGDDPAETMSAMWRHLRDPSMWPIYRLGFSLRPRRDPAVAAQDRRRWVDAITPLVSAFGVPAADAPAEAMLWLATCRGLLSELVDGADPELVDAAADRFFVHYREAAGA
jgi:AcrR family transcriptional regulator